MLLFNYSLVEKTYCQNTNVFDDISPSIFYLHDSSYYKQIVTLKKILLYKNMNIW